MYKLFTNIIKYMAAHSIQFCLIVRGSQNADGVLLVVTKCPAIELKVLA